MFEPSCIDAFLESINRIELELDLLPKLKRGPEVQETTYPLRARCHHLHG